MTDEQFKQINDKLDALNANLTKAHTEEVQWAQTLMNQQTALGRGLKLDTAPRQFIPYYNPYVAPSPIYPQVFNKYGEPMEFFFMSDREGAHIPNDPNSRYIIWDRYNYGNETHFYSHDEIFRTVGKPKRKFAFLVESRSIRSDSYKNVLVHKDYVEKNFDMLFTFDVQILDEISNARFAPFPAIIWYGINSEGIMAGGAEAGFLGDGKPKEGFIISPENYKRKTKNISMICSEKEFTTMQALRKALAFKCKNESLADTYGQFDGGAYCKIELPFEHYRYSIAVENGIEPYYFTEKILNCFAAQTIPIYLGATKIDQFFNADGIIQIGIEDCEHIEKILKLCTAEEYERRLPAVLDNFNRAMRAMTQTRWDDVYVNYIRGK